MDAEQEYWSAVAAADRWRAQDTVRRLVEHGWSPSRVVEDLVSPSQERVGDLWLRGEWSVAQEHAATAVSEAVVHGLMSLQAPPRDGAEQVIVSCLQGERHALPALIVAHGLGLRGMRVVYLGADPEPSALLAEVLRLRPRAVLFSASLTSSLSAQKMFFHSLAAVGIPLIVGGRAFGDRPAAEKRASALGATAYAETVDEVLALLARFPARTASPEWPALDARDEDAMWLERYRAEIAPQVIRTLSERRGGTDALASRWPEVSDHLEHVLGCVAAAIVTGDETMMEEVRDWLEAVLRHRSLDTGLVVEVWDVLGEALRGHPVARLVLAATRPAQAS